MKSCLLQIDQLHHRLQKLKDQSHNSAEIHSISLGVKEDCYERNLNESVLNRNMYLSSSNANDKDIKNEKKNKKKTDSKTKITKHDDPSDKRKDSVYVEKVVHNEPADNLIFSDQVSNKNINKSSNDVVFFGGGIPRGINIQNLKSRL